MFAIICSNYFTTNKRFKRFWINLTVMIIIGIIRDGYSYFIPNFFFFPTKTSKNRFFNWKVQVDNLRVTTV